MSILIPTIATGVGIPVLTSWISSGAKGFKKEATLRNVALSSMVGIAIAGLAFMSVQKGITEPIPVTGVPCTATGKSASDVTVRLGVQGGGVKYPGVVYGTPGPSAQYPNGNVIFVD